MYNSNIMSYKVVKTEESKPQYAEPIQQKIDNAAKFGTVYVLSDEDNRIQQLYNRKDLRTEEILRYLERVRSPLDNKEYLVASKTINFYNRDTGAFVDRFINIEGVVEEPIITTNDKGESVANETRTRYVTPFSAEAVDEYLSEADSPVPLSFYDGTISGSRVVRNKTVVGNESFFKEADWNELQLGKETGLVSSMVNTLGQVKELKGENPRLNSREAFVNRKSKLRPELKQVDRTIQTEEDFEGELAPSIIQGRTPQNTIVTNVDTIKIRESNPSYQEQIEEEEINKEDSSNGNSIDNTKEENEAPAKSSRRGSKSSNKQ